MKRDYDIQPEELPQSAHARWGVPEPVKNPEIDDAPEHKM
jgi:hypothetical protein